MAHMQCNCGNTLSNVCFPNVMEGKIKGLFEYKERNVWECLECGRLWIEIADPEINGCHISKSYLPEDGKVCQLFSVGTGNELINHLKKEWIRHKDIFKLIEEGFFNDDPT